MICKLNRVYLKIQALKHWNRLWVNTTDHLVNTGSLIQYVSCVLVQLVSSVILIIIIIIHPSTTTTMMPWTWHWLFLNSIYIIYYQSQVLLCLSNKKAVVLVKTVDCWLAIISSMIIIIITIMTTVSVVNVFRPVQCKWRLMMREAVSSQGYLFWRCR